MVLRQLEIRFGALPKHAKSRVENAKADQLQQWAERLLTAANLEEIFKDYGSPGPEVCRPESNGVGMRRRV